MQLVWEFLEFVWIYYEFLKLKSYEHQLLTLDYPLSNIFEVQNASTLIGCFK